MTNISGSLLYLSNVSNNKSHEKLKVCNISYYEDCQRNSQKFLYTEAGARVGIYWIEGKACHLGGSGGMPPIYFRPLIQSGGLPRNKIVS